jgi:glycosyltransferase A (GT-A) superfamily protein (DUF2064 family)
MRSSRPLFDLARARIRRATRALGGVEFLVAEKQTGATFSERLANALAEARSRGHEAIVVVPQDVLGITARVLRQAFEALEKDDLVLGPSLDGGVYLIGARVAIESLLGRVRWQTPFVLEDLLAAAPRARLLSPLEEVDTKRDLLRFLRGAAGGRNDPELARLASALLAHPEVGGAPLPHALASLQTERIRGPPRAISPA